MTIDTQKLRDGPYLRDGKETRRIMDGAADHIDTQTAALTIAREFVATMREELIVSHGVDGVIPADDVHGLAGVADCDAILAQIDAALSGEGK